MVSKLDLSRLGPAALSRLLTKARVSEHQNAEPSIICDTFSENYSQTKEALQ